MVAGHDVFSQGPTFAGSPQALSQVSFPVKHIIGRFLMALSSATGDSFPAAFVVAFVLKQRRQHPSLRRHASTCQDFESVGRALCHLPSPTTGVDKVKTPPRFTSDVENVKGSAKRHNGKN